MHMRDFRLIFPRGIDLIGLACLLGIGYGRVINSYFLADDFGLIQQAVGARGEPAWGLALQHLWSGQALESFRPMVTFVHVVAYSLWGVHQSGYHIMNLLLHFLNAVGLYVLVASIAPQEPRFLAFSAAALFITHPIHPEAVTFIGSVPVLLCAVFYLGALVAYVRGGGWRAAAPIAFALALLSKEEAISLPFAVVIVAWAVRQESGWRRTVFALRDALPYTVVLAAYFGYRRLVFGRFTPSYHSGLMVAPMDTIYGFATLLHVLAAPVNRIHAGSWASVLVAMTVALLVAAVVIGVYSRRPSPRAVLCCLGLILVACIPIHSMFPYMANPGLTSSRFAYLPSVGFVTAIAVAIAWGPHPKQWGWARLGLPILLLVGSNLVLLNVNNDAWRAAANLMRRLHRDVVRLTGNNANVEVANLPFTVGGVLFEIGAFRDSLFHPFTPGNTLHSRERIVTVVDTRRGSIEVEPSAPNAELTWEVVEHTRRTAPNTQVIRVRFKPHSPRTSSGEIRITSATCRSGVVTIPIRGRGTDAPPFPTYLGASFSPTSATESANRTRTFSGTVDDLKDGLDADGVSLFIEPGVPWRLRSFVFEGNRWQEASTPVSIADGGSKSFRLELSPTRASASDTVVVRIAAQNAPIVPAIPGKTALILTSSAPAVFLAAADARQVGIPAAPASATCPGLTVTPAAVDLGTVSTKPFPITFNRPFIFYGDEPDRLFWDDRHGRVVPLSRLDAAPSPLAVTGSELSHWTRTPDLAYLEVSPSIAGLHATQFGQSLEKDDLHFRADAGSYFVVRMRLLNARSPFARLSWKADTDESFGEVRSAFITTLPDGFWHVYAVPLHSLPGWRSAAIVRALRFAPLLETGWAEIASLAVVGPIP
jgi:hypothetical protein